MEHWLEMGLFRHATFLEIPRILEIRKKGFGKLFS